MTANTKSLTGLWCGLMPLIPYALLAPSPHLSLGPFAICSLLTSQALLTVTDCNVNPDESPSLPNCDEDTKYLHAVTVLTFLVGTIELVLSFLSAGEAVARILSVPVTKAYCSACGTSSWFLSPCINTRTRIYIHTTISFLHRNISNQEFFRSIDTKYEQSPCSVRCME